MQLLIIDNKGLSVKTYFGYPFEIDHILKYVMVNNEYYYYSKLKFRKNLVMVVEK